MGYSPKHAKPLSLRSAGLKSHHHRPFGAGDSGRHRADTIVPAPRVPPDETFPAAGKPGAAGTVRAAGAGDADETVDAVGTPGADRAVDAAGTPGADDDSGMAEARGAADDRGTADATCAADAKAGTRKPAAGRGAHAEVLAMLIPVPRAPLTGS